MGAGADEREESGTGADEGEESGTGADEGRKLGGGTRSAPEPGLTTTDSLPRAGSAPLTGSDATSFSFGDFADRRSKSAFHSANT